MLRFTLGLTLTVLLVSPSLGQQTQPAGNNNRPAVRNTPILPAIPPRAAQPAARKQARPAMSPSDAPTTVTPEIWYYMQERERMDNPKQAIRRAAEYRASQRRARIASSRWFGYSRLRPQASPIPYTGTAAPTWVGNNANPYFWSGVSRSGALFIHPGVIYR